MRISVVGLGHVGLVTSVCVAEWGHSVLGIDADELRLATLRAGSVPFFEPGLQELMRKNVASGQLSFGDADRIAEAARADIVIVAVGTEDAGGGWHVGPVLACLEQLRPHLSDDSVLVIRSTVPPDSVHQLVATQEDGPRPRRWTEGAIILNPEFSREGSAVEDFMHPERVVLGIVVDPSGRGLRTLRSLYSHIQAPLLELPAIDAALAKLGANLYLATRVSFVNELAGLCDGYGASIENVTHVMGYDPRIGRRYLRAGIGFGGSCLPHQVLTVATTAASAGMEVPLLEAVAQVNRRQQERFVETLEGMLSGALDGCRIGLLGLAFKPGTDDVREAPALNIARSLISRGATVVGYDPMLRARRAAAESVSGLQVASTAEEALEGAHAAGLMTEWPEFGELDWSAIRGRMRGAVMLDGRNFLSAEVLLAAGFSYAGFGRGVTSAAARAS